MTPPRARSRALRLALRLGVLLAACAAALLGLEAFARLADPFGVSYYRDTNRYFNEAVVLPPDAARPDGRLFENAPGVDLFLRTFRFATDAHGLRTSAAARPLDAEGLRILFLGDSVTLAWGVDDEESWVRRLEGRARAADGRPVVALNAGHLQYDTLQETDWLLAHAEELSPDAVVITVVVNDLDDAYATFLGLMNELAARPPPEQWTALERLEERLPVWFRGLHALAQFRAEQRTARTAEDRAGERIEDQPGYEEGWRRCAAGFERAAAECARRGIPLVVLDHTTPRIPDVERWCADHGVPWYDFTFTPGEGDLDLRNSAADAHANELGNELLARKAERALADAGILAQPGGDGG